MAAAPAGEGAYFHERRSPNNIHRGRVILPDPLHGNTQKAYPFVWLDAIHYKIREDGWYQSKAVYTVLASLRRGHSFAIRSLTFVCIRKSQQNGVVHDDRQCAFTGCLRQFRKLTKTKGAFPNENSLLKLLYLG